MQPRHSLTLKTLWRDVGFSPNENQEAAIRHVDGPLYLTAGPGSGKTRVVLWRTVNLLVFHGVEPQEIFLSTFTEKAAQQLKEGLRALLNQATSYTGVHYDISRMYVGTVHALCQQLLGDRRLAPRQRRHQVPRLLDELGQYFYLYRTRMWEQLCLEAGFEGETPQAQINAFFEQKEIGSLSKHKAVTNCLSLFNRLSEEQIDPARTREMCEDPALRRLLSMYAGYRSRLETEERVPITDFSLLQQHALSVLRQAPGRGVFRHVIVDEYQDTNSIQERIFFELAGAHGNLCVVGDDDQALYRFRGATVENFVEFPHRCHEHLGVEPRTLPLSTNYRSRKGIVDYYTCFIDRCDWEKEDAPGEHYRVTSKNIHAHSGDDCPAVVASAPSAPVDACEEVAGLVRQLLDEGKVDDPSQVAFLYPSLKSTQVPRMRQALESEGLRVYAPRAGRFLEVEESADLFGVMLHVFGRLGRGDYPGSDYNDFHDWLAAAYARGDVLLKADDALAQYVQRRKDEIRTVCQDYKTLQAVTEKRGWDPDDPYRIAEMKRALHEAPGLSHQAKKSIASTHFENIARQRQEDGRPFTLRYIIRRATSLDWNVLDLFYRLCGFDHFRAMFDLAEQGEDEGPICNLSLISDYLSRFADEYASVITASLLSGGGFRRLFFGSYLYTLFRLGESEYEDADDPFPKGRIPFLTIHQAKGLEFPVVVLGNPRKGDRGPQRVEEVVRPLVERDGEPLGRIAEFDIMRMFYVALSRAENLLVIPHWKSRGNYINQPFRDLMDQCVRIADFDTCTLPPTEATGEDLPQNYSYTADYIQYQQCPRQYMIFRKYGFAPSRSQTRFFGSLVHRTLEDLHQHLIAQRARAEG